MTAGRNDRGPLRIRRRGRHAAPSQVEKVALQAGKAAPAVAIAGVLVAAPQASHALAASAKPVSVTAQGHAAAAAAHTTAKAQATATHTAATLDSLSTRAVTVTSAKSAKHAATVQGTTYRVRSGDTLAKIAKEFFHNDDWQYLYHENENTISNPDVLYVGESLFIPASAPAHYTLSDYAPKHAKAETTSSSSTKTSGSTTTEVVQSASQYSCSSLETLWEQAGGSSADALMAADIAMAESGGNPNAISPTDDYGLWQINASNGALATLDPLQNAKSAITLSDNGVNWDAWTTYTSGAYSGKC
jgi:LysM repeat protein